MNFDKNDTVALINYAYLVHAVMTTDEVVKAMEYVQK